MSDDTPTQRFDQQPAAATPTSAAKPPRKRSPLIPTLITVGAILLVAVVVLGSLLLTRKTDTPIAAGTDTATNAPQTPGPTPTVTVTVTATPAPNNGGSGGGNSGGGSQHPNGNNVLLTNYSISPMVVDCSSGAPANAANLTVKWHSINGYIAYFGVNTVDAKAGGMGWNLPASGSDKDFPTSSQPYQFPCGDAQQEYTITVLGQGSEQSLQLTVKRKQ